ncbi:PIN domain-containing protein [bacterium]|nr:PIN domain-containing protein [bacterium]
MITAVDTNILLDVLLPDVGHQAASLSLLHQATQEGSLVVVDVVASELGAQFPVLSDMENFLRSVSIALLPMSLTAAHDAGQRWRHYLRHRKGGRERMVADFMIAAHALHHADRLLSRDLGFYRSHFKDLHLMEP